MLTVNRRLEMKSEYTKLLRCGCVIRRGDTITDYWVDYCPLHKSAPKLYEALLAVYKDIDLQNVQGGSDELNILVQQAIAEVEGK